MAHTGIDLTLAGEFDSLFGTSSGDANNENLKVYLYGTDKQGAYQMF